MAEFLTTNGTSFQIENIIKDSRTELVLLSPFLQISKTHFERLKDATNRNVGVKIVYGKNDLIHEQLNALTTLKNLELFFFENLHAKCYFNEKKMVLTSMNLYEFSEKNNREMGVLIDRVLDKELFENAMNETLSIIQSAEKVSLRNNHSKSHEKIANSFNGWKQPKKKAYCIRCKSLIPLNIDEPFCSPCFEIWSNYENEDYVEKACHKCGNEWDTSFRKPMCYSCFFKQQF